MYCTVRITVRSAQAATLNRKGMPPCNLRQRQWPLLCAVSVQEKTKDVFAHLRIMVV